MVGQVGIPPDAEVRQQDWDRFSEVMGQTHYRGLVRVLSRLPSPPRCEVCGGPFTGPGGRLMRLMGREPSRKNPRWCAACFEKSPPGGFTTVVGVLFADVRSSTRLGGQVPLERLADTFNEFYDRVTRVVLQHGLVDKFIGDEVMAIYLPSFAPAGRFEQTLVRDAERVLRSVGYGTSAGPLVDIGIGLDVGPAYLGRVGRGEVEDFTAIGDVVNIASRLQGEAGPGQVVLPEVLAQRAGLPASVGTPSQVTLKGKDEPVGVRVLTVTRLGEADPRRSAGVE